ncbi:MAG: HAD-IC family P-type ATPase, partial [Candidatus Pacearchaeota archaeon]
NLLVPVVKVIREGIVREISSLELVPGDIIIVSEGDRMTADCRILHENDLQANEAVLTGESFPQDKSSDAISLKTELADRENMLYAGTSIVRGSARAVVVSTNMKTEFGKIASLVQTIKIRKTPLEEKLDSFSKKVAIVVIALAAITLFIGIIRGENLFNMFLTGLALVVSVIPEGLPAIIAITLAFAIRKMKSSNALIRKLPAAETLGRVTVICTDKTGTLTEENMSVTSLFCNNQFIAIKNNSFYQNGEEINPREIDELYALLRTGILCNNARIEIVNNEIKAVGDPTEKALAISALKSGLVKKDETEKEVRVKEYSFSSSRKMMSIIRKRGEKLVNYVKGAPDVIIRRCSREMKNGKIVAITQKRRAELLAFYEVMASEALRVLAFAFKPLPSKFSQETAESSLIFLGFQGMLDAPRKEVEPAIADCKTAGIKVKMITGDSLLTAKEIAKMIKLYGEAIEEKDLGSLSEQEFNDCVREKTIFARITPETKLRIIQTLKVQGEVVAVTGDGVNDILALKEAHIGVAMGIRGSDVARDVSDIILLDDNFSTIVQAIREGRKVYDNMKKSIKAHLSANGSELFVVMFALFLSWPLPLLPLAILWMNLITDALPTLALTVEKEEPDIMKRKPRYKESILDNMILFLIIAGVFTFAATVLIFGLNYQADLAKARTMALTTAVLCEMFVILSCRSRDEHILKIGLFSNKYLIGAILITIILQLIVVYTPLSLIFGFTSLSLKELAIVTAVSMPVFIFFETLKLFKIKI